MAKSSLVDVEVIIAVKTEKAVMVKLDDLSDGIWLPLSQIEVDEVDCRSIYRHASRMARDRKRLDMTVLLTWTAALLWGAVFWLAVWRIVERIL